MVTLSPAFPWSGESLLSVGASPKQDGAFPAISAVENFFAGDCGAGVLVRPCAGLLAFFSCLTGSAAELPTGVIAARPSASIPIAIMILGPVAEDMNNLRLFATRTDVSSIAQFADVSSIFDRGNIANVLPELFRFEHSPHDFAGPGFRERRHNVDL